VNFEHFQQACANRIENYLEKLLSVENPTTHLNVNIHEALRYAVLNGGKRMRPLLVYAVGEALGNPIELLDAPAAAVELIHCYSLVHDDLPAIDNDDLRRGKPTCHKVFGEATAVLTGDALQTLAFQLLSDPILNPISAENKLTMIHLLANKSGVEGMIGGQSLDLAAEGKTLFLTIGDLKEIHHKKTGALIEAAVSLGALASHTAVSAHKMTLLQEYARCIGLAFQIQDDILDIEGTTQTLGKSAGKDEKQKKTTFPSKLGLETARQYAHTLHLQALEAIVFLQKNGHKLAELSFLMINRSN
jgi:geranylgeranyl pyrophosphate synthase